LYGEGRTVRRIRSTKFVRAAEKVRRPELLSDARTPPAVVFTILSQRLRDDALEIARLGRNQFRERPIARLESQLLPDIIA